ncbi:MAG: HAD-IA family hydrolase [Candidatus Nanoarchaeia archaeon]|jgi:FMN phosphatase YigB (HAD superfamily)
MIKVIAFDLVGVLVKDSKFNSDIEGSKELIKSLKIINNSYAPKNLRIFEEIKKIDKNLKLVIATNNVPLIRQWIGNNFSTKFIDKIYISSELGYRKPSPEFFKKILKDYNIKPEELLLIDDMQRNILGAKALGIKAVLLKNFRDLKKEVLKKLES